MSFKSTICSYPERGKWGNNKYRGNCSGKLIEDIITTPCYRFFDKNGRPQLTLSDYMVGSGTTEDVCRAYGIDGVFLDLNRGFDMLSMEIPDRPQNIFWHPPYAQMITYSDVMYKADDIINKYGFDPRPNDLSRAIDWDDFINKMNYCAIKQFTALEKGGRMFILVGDWKQNRRLYSMFCDIVKLGTLEQVIIKAEHNCWSDNNTYTNMNFVPIQHEYLIVFRKDDVLVIPASYTIKKEFKVLDSYITTWLDAICSILEEYGALSIENITAKLKSFYPVKCSKNNNIDAKVRQTAHRYPKFIKNCGNGIYCKAA